MKTAKHTSQTFTTRRAAGRAANVKRMLDRTIVGLRHIGNGNWAVDTWQQSAANGR